MSEVVTERPLVVLVHGIWMSGVELLPLARSLRRAGFSSRIFRYTSLRRPLEDSAERLHEFIAGLAPGQLHLLGHSLGGLLILELFDAHPVQPPGRVLFMGSPLAGSSVARHLAARPGLRRMLGRAAPALVSEEFDWRGGRPVAMIAGSRGFGVGSLFGGLPEPNDGTVAVEETGAPWLDAHLTVPHSHFGMLFSPAVHRQVVAWFRQGRFLAETA